MNVRNIFQDVIIIVPIPLEATIVHVMMDLHLVITAQLSVKVCNIQVIMSTLLKIS